MRARGMTIARFLLEAGFLVLVAAAVGLAELGWAWIAVVMFCAWLLVAVVERSETRSRPGRKQAAPEMAQPEPQPEPVQSEPEPVPEPAPQPEPEPVALAVAPPPPPPPPPPEPEPEPEPEIVVPLVRRDGTPREWNVWELERIANEHEGRDPAKDEERALLLMSLRQFANASGDLPTDFDPLIREAFGAALDELRIWA